MNFDHNWLEVWNMEAFECKFSMCMRWFYAMAHSCRHFVASFVQMHVKHVKEINEGDQNEMI